MKIPNTYEFENVPIEKALTLTLKISSGYSAIPPTCS